MTARRPWVGPPLHGAAVALLTLLWLAATAGLRPLMLPDEGRYVGVAWEMLRSGDWLTPTLDGLPYFHKPPLFYWITALALKLFGLHAWASRAAPVLGATLAALALYFFLRRWLGARKAMLALVVLLVQPLLYIGAQFANLDMLVAGCISATTVLLAHAALAMERAMPYRSALAGAYALAALGVLAKGLIGVMIPALVLTAWLLAQGHWRLVLRLIWLPGVLLFAAIAMPWFLAMQARFPGFMHYFFVVQHVQRFAGSGFNNVQPLWFYPAVLGLMSLPGLPWLVRALRRSLPAAPAALQAQLRLLLWLWVAVVVVFFSLPQSKLLGYVLPAVPPLAALMAIGRLQQADMGGATARRSQLLWRAGLGLACAVSVGAVLALAWRPQHSTKPLALALASQRAPGQPVFMLQRYDFDVPFYARLTDPVGVVADWTPQPGPRRDNWQAELADAGAFAPASAQAALLSAEGFARAVCAAPVSWVIGTPEAGAAQPLLHGVPVVFSASGQALWRIDLKAMPCPGRPNAG